MNRDLLPGSEDRLVDKHHKNRLISEGVFCFHDRSTWEEHCLEAFSSIFIENYQDHLIGIKKLYSDEIDESDDIRNVMLDKERSLLEQLNKKFKEKFSFIRMYHTTRVRDVNSFYSNGLKFYSNEEIEDQARAIFLNGQFQGINEEYFSEKVKEALYISPGFKYRSNDRVRHYGFLSEKTFMHGDCDHFLMYGSEYVQVIGAYLFDKYTTERVLSKIGVATVFVVDVPVDFIEDDILREITGNIAVHFMNLSLRRKSSIDFDKHEGCLILRRDIPREFISGHYHLDI